MPHRVGFPVRELRLLEEILPDELEELPIASETTLAVREHEFPLRRAPVLHRGLEVDRFAVGSERRHRLSRELHPAVFIVLRRLDPTAVLRPCALDVDALAFPVDVGALERRDLAPAETSAEPHHEK